MSKNSTIEWTHHTLNPWRGCTKVHEGCAHCYAERDSKRFPAMRGIWGPNGTRVMASADMWRQPLAWNREAEAKGERHRVFCASLADVFEDWRGAIVNHQGKVLTNATIETAGPKSRALTMDDLRRDLFALIDQTPNLDWLVLTKRPENIRRMWPDESGASAGWLKPRENVHLGTSISLQKHADAQIPELLKCRDLAPVLFLSMEPLLGAIDLSGFFGGEYATVMGSEKSYNFGLDWIIVGGESGHNARPCHPDWVRSIRDQCVSAGVPFFFKQWGEFAPLGKASGLDPDHHYPGRDHRVSVHSGVPMDEPTSMFRLGKKLAGRVLDGKVWDQFPEVKESVPA